MNKIFKLSVGFFLVIFSLFTLQNVATAQVYGDFDTVRIVEANYQPLEDGIEIPASAFGLPPTWLQDLDDGYSYPNGIPIGFPFEFGGEVYNRLWVCINGFITFSAPPLTPAKDPTALFYDNTSYPRNVIAPFWGDHRYRADYERFQGFKPTKILYKSDPINGMFIVEWRYLNINDQTIPSSIASFQVRLYRSTDPYSAQGNIEFAYGQVGGNEYTNDTRVITRNASVGIKGEFSPADFINGLMYNQPPEVARTRMDLTNEWTPSGGTNKRILFTALARFNVEEFWGDGDADLSKGIGKKHYGLPQNRYVTVNDARIIMKSIATNVPLDSVRRRAAYHGDVNHNGRYYYDQNGVRKDIKWRNKFYGDSLPAEVGSLKQIFFRANEYDAALILHYISARIPQLPWLYDTIPQYGKISVEEFANNIEFGKPIDGGNCYKIPVYLNGTLQGALGLSISFNTEVSISGLNENLISETNANRVVIAGSGNFDNLQPLFYVDVPKNNIHLVADEIRFNDEDKGKYGIVLSTNDNQVPTNIIISPNPVVNNDVHFILSKQNDLLAIEILDVNGSVVSRLNNSDNSVITWNLKDSSGNIVPNGLYFVRVTTSSGSIIEKFVVNR